MTSVLVCDIRRLHVMGLIPDRETVHDIEIDRHRHRHRHRPNIWHRPKIAHDKCVYMWHTSFTCAMTHSVDRGIERGGEEIEHDKCVDMWRTSFTCDMSHSIYRETHRVPAHDKCVDMWHTSFTCDVTHSVNRKANRKTAHDAWNESNVLICDIRRLHVTWLILITCNAWNECQSNVLICDTSRLHVTHVMSLILIARHDILITCLESHSSRHVIGIYVHMWHTWDSHMFACDICETHIFHMWRTWDSRQWNETPDMFICDIRETHICSHVTYVRLIYSICDILGTPDSEMRLQTCLYVTYVRLQTGLIETWGAGVDIHTVDTRPSLFHVGTHFVVRFVPNKLLLPCAHWMVLDDM